MLSTMNEDNSLSINLGTYSMGFFFPLTRVLLEYKKEENLLFLRYLESFDIDQKKKHKGKVKEVSLIPMDQDKCQIFVNVFMTIFQVRKNLNKKGIVWNNNSGACKAESPFQGK